MMTDTRPKWQFNTPIHVAEWLWQHSVKIIEIYHRHDGSLTTEHYLIFSTYMFKKEEAQLAKNRLENVSPLIFEYQGNFPEEVIYTPQYGTSLVKLHTRLINTLRNMADWDRDNKKDIAEYARLKNRFNDE